MSEKKLSILTVEDEVGFRKSIVAYFRDCGYQVFEAGNGRDGLELLKQQEFDLVLTDLKMPEMEGVTFIAEAQKINPDLPMIVLSGEGLATEAVRAVRAGAWDYITKPISDFAVLDNQINSVLSKFEHRQQEKNVKLRLEALVEKQSQQLAEIMHYDPTTSLPLRQLFIDQAKKALQEAPTSNDSFVVLGLDNIVTINDTYGHHVGKIALNGFIKILKRQLADGALLGKLYDDQIAILVREEGRIHTIVQSLISLTKEAFVVAGHDLPINLSIGVSTRNTGDMSAEKLLSRASLAQYKARRNGTNQVVYCSAELENESLQRLTMESSLRRALANNEFLLHYQPQVNAIEEKVTGCEALLRWQPAMRETLVSPAEFIPVLEETGLIEQVGAWCLEEACSQYMQWRKKGLAPIQLSVNVSAKQFHSGNFLGIVKHVLSKTGMDAECLCLELTESIVMKHVDQTLDILNALHEIKIKLSLDDFGTGYSSLKYLHQMKLHELKIDKSFIDGIPHNTTSISIIETILEMAKTMHIEVVAEGVENDTQLTFIKHIKCKSIQGFYFSRPLIPEMFLRYALQKTIKISYSYFNHS